MVGLVLGSQPVHVYNVKFNVFSMLFMPHGDSLALVCNAGLLNNYWSTFVVYCALDF